MRLQHLLAAGTLALSMPVAAAAQSADSLFHAAQAKAQMEHKNVLLVFSASWCGPCHLYERFLDDPQMRPITGKAFVVQRIDVGENPNDQKHQNTPGGEKLRSSMGADAEPGFPFIAITDENGKLLVNSDVNGKKGDNVGYPAIPREIDW